MTKIPKAPKYRASITDRFLERQTEAIRDFLDDVPHRVVWDTKVRQLRAIIGRHKTSFGYFEQHRTNGKRSATIRTLGHFPEMNVAQARKAAIIVAGENARDGRQPGRRAVIRFSDAFTDYKQHLRDKAARAGKSATWLQNVARIGERLLLPTFGKWPLVDMSRNPRLIREWHVKTTAQTGPVIANRAAQILRATYRNAMKLSNDLPLLLPTRAIAFNSETPRETGISDWAAWGAAWSTIPNQNHRAFALCLLLTGCRPSELAALRWSSVHVRRREIVIGKAKAGRDIVVPLSWPIARCLRMARAADADRALVAAVVCRALIYRPSGIVSATPSGLSRRSLASTSYS